MNDKDLTNGLTRVVGRLSDPKSFGRLFHPHKDGSPLPSGKVLEEIVCLSRSILFPGYYGNSKVNVDTIGYHIGVNVERVYHLLQEQVRAGLCFNGADDTSDVKHRSRFIASQLIDKLPDIREILGTDVLAAYNGDPAAVSMGEVIACYPIIKALVNYRIAHELFLLGVPLIPRMLTEMAHSETGIDIHPQASIGRYFTVDHGTGVVIGATCVIGDNVKIYQGVTLGAKSFPLDNSGNPIKGIPRHPVIGNNVVIYANATVLGRIKIGDGCTIGANVWVTEDIEANMTISKSPHGQIMEK